MGPVSYKVSAPGSLFLLGEHAVLHNKKALVMSIDKRITVSLTPRNDSLIHIHSALGHHETSLTNLRIQTPFEYVLTAIQKYLPELNTGFDLEIESDFSSTQGLGSSAAVCLSTIAVLDKYTQQRDSKSLPTILDKLFQSAREVIRSVQGLGSGADVAASAVGGVVLYQQDEPSILQKFSQLPPVVVCYSGFKMKTVDVVNHFEHQRLKYPKMYECLFSASDEAVSAAQQALEKEDWPALGELFNSQQGVMDAYGVGLPVLTQLIDSLRQESTIWGAKISGSGLGDCVIGLGTLKTSIPVVSVSPSFEGLRYE